MFRQFHWCIALCFALLIPFTRAAETIPPVPTRYFNDYAGAVSAATAQELNSRLEQFEKDTSSQIVVAIYPKMQSDSSVQDYTVRVAQKWQVGQKDKRNGAILFVFTQDRQMFLQVGYGLEGAIPDATAKQITEFEIKPHFKNGNYDAGLRAGVEAILQAARGEYKGTGRTVAQGRRSTDSISIGTMILFLFIFFAIFALSTRRSRRRGRVYRRSGWDPWTGGTWGGGSSGGWSGGGGDWSGGSSGGSFSSGGGDFGGGGAGSSW